MGKKAQEMRRHTRRRIRTVPLSPDEQQRLAEAVYEGHSHHKRNPGDFGLQPPAAPRPDKTLCDEAGIFRKAEAKRLFSRARERALVSENTTHGGYPKQLWVVDDRGRVFEAMHGGSRNNAYHGYPIRHCDPLHEQVLRAWEREP